MGDIVASFLQKKLATNYMDGMHCAQHAGSSNGNIGALIIDRAIKSVDCDREKISAELLEELLKRL